MDTETSSGATPAWLETSLVIATSGFGLMKKPWQSPCQLLGQLADCLGVYFTLQDATVSRRESILQARDFMR